MTVSEVTASVDRHVRSMFSELEKAINEMHRLERIRDRLTDEERSDSDVTGLLAEQLRKAREDVRSSTVRINGYVDGQKAMFKSRGMNPDMAYTHAIAPTGGKTSRGVEMHAVVKRGVPLLTD